MPKALEEAFGLSIDRLVVELAMHKRGLSMNCHLAARMATSWRLRSWSCRRATRLCCMA
jgi:hypothetical protein